MSRKVRNILLWLIWLTVVAGIIYWRSLVVTAGLVAVSTALIALLARSSQVEGAGPVRTPKPVQIPEEENRRFRNRRFLALGLGMLALPWLILIQPLTDSQTWFGWVIGYGVAAFFGVSGAIFFIANETQELRLRLALAKKARDAVDKCDL